MNMQRSVIRVSQLALLWTGAALAAGPASPPSPVPEAIRAPAGERVVLTTHASGAQVYVCATAADGKSQWTLKGPDAELRDEKGKVIGHHYAGPTWKLNDGSEVTGKAVAHVDPPDQSIAWLLLSVVSHAGKGALSAATHIQRINTHGGQPPPATQCDATKRNTETRSAYSADYYFYAPETAEPPPQGSAY